MQFKVPQFIDIEDKIFGPFTFRQFAYLIGGGGMVFVVYKILPFFIAIFIIIPIIVLTGLLVFYRINNKPFVFYLEAGFNYLLSSKLFIWKQKPIKADKKEDTKEDIPITSFIPTSTPNKLSDLSWSLDVEDKKDDTKIV